MIGITHLTPPQCKSDCSRRADGHSLDLVLSTWLEEEGRLNVVPPERARVPERGVAVARRVAIPDADAVKLSRDGDQRCWNTRPWTKMDTLGPTWQGMTAGGSA